MSCFSLGRISAAVVLASAAFLLFATAHDAQAGRGDCGQPLSNGSNPVATDARRVLTAGVGATLCSDPSDPAAPGLPFDSCICDINGSGVVNATDALLDLQKAVGQTVTLACPCPVIPPLAFSLDVNPDPPRAGESMNVLVSISNTSNNPILDLRVDVRLPTQLDAFSTSRTRGAAVACIGDGNQAFCSPGERLQWTLGTLLPGAGTTLVMPAPVAAATADGVQIDLNAEALIAGTISATATRTVFVDSQRVLDLVLSEDTDPIAPGGTLTYRLDLGNATTSSLAQNTVLSMDVPEGLEFVAASDGGVLNGAGDTVEWSVGTLSPGQNGSREVSFTAGAGSRDGSIIHAQAQIADGGSELTRAVADTRVQSDSPLLLSFELNPDPAMPGERLQALLTVTNRGSTPLSQVEVETFLPGASESFFVTSLTTGADVTCFGDANLATCNPREFVVFDVGTLQAGSGVVLRMPPAIVSSAEVGGVITYDARARDADRNNAGERKAVRVDSPRVLDLAIDDDLDPVEPGDGLTLTIGFGNRTTSTLAQDVSLVFPVPPGTTFTSASDAGVFDAGAGTVTWALGSLLPGQHGRRSVLVAVNPASEDGALVHSLVFATDSSGRRSRAEVDTRVQSGVVLLLTLEVNPDPVRAGETVDTILTVSNTGLVGLLDVEVELLLPGELEPFFTTSRTRGATVACRGDANPATCNVFERVVFDVGTLAAGAGVDLAAPPQILTSGVPGTQVTFDALARDSSGNNVAARGSMGIVNPRVLDLAIAESIDPAEPGGDITYRLSFGNLSTATIAQNVGLVVAVPTGTTFVTASDGGTFDSGAGLVAWALGTQNPGLTGTRELVVAVDAQLADGAVIRAQADIADDAGNATRARSETRVHTGVPLHVAIGLNPDPAVPGQTIDGVLTVTNTGLVQLFDVVVEVFLPDDLATFFVTARVGGPTPTCSGDANPTTCSSRETLQWAVGTLAAGSGVTMTMPPVVATAAPPGTVMTYNVRARETGGGDVGARGAVRIEQPRLLDLAIDDDVDPIAPDATLTYTLRYGNQSSATSEQNLVLGMRVPDGTSFVSAPGGGVLDAGTGRVTWDVGALPPGSGGVRQLVVVVDSVLNVCTTLQGQADLTGDSGRRTRATVETQVDEGGPLEITLTLAPDPVAAAAAVTGTLEVTNNGPVPLFAVTAEVVLPDGIANFATSTTSGAAASCSGDANTLICSSHERLIFTVGTLNAAATATMLFSPSFAAAVVPGRVVTMNAKVSEVGGAEAPARASVLVTAAP